MKHVDSQTLELDACEMQALVDMAKRHRRPITIDWANRTIRVLSPLITDEKVQLSDGPMQYRDILAFISDAAAR
jgi:hypothetical protein